MKCPNCGCFVSAQAIEDSDWMTDIYFDFVEGTCPKCGKSYAWKEIYKYDHDEDIQEIDPNDHL